jgi:diguanylate cyclase (GGDEF)-like protein
MSEMNRRMDDAKAGKPKKIYIADDEANIRIAIKTFLENAGYAVTDFENGDLLLAAFNEREADLVILDVMMPGSNGFVICKELRKISRVPIFMLTARDSDLDYATGLDIGSDDYLTKPFSPMALVMRVKAIFRRLEFERKSYERDPMTGLYNKVSGVNYVKNEIMVRDENSTHALFVIDIDDFKNINDNLGHTVGDKVIAEVADIIASLFRDADIVFRFGGDEFAAFTVNISEENFVERKAAELGAALRKSYGEGDNIYNISASIGIACYPRDGRSYEELFDNADAALYKTKEKGKDTYTVYSE